MEEVASKAGAYQPDECMLGLTALYFHEGVLKLEQVLKVLAVRNIVERREVVANRSTVNSAGRPF